MQSLAEVRTCSWRSIPCRAPQYIATLRRCKMRERLRSARRAMHARFPFSEALWLEWLDDELPGAREPDARAQAEALLDTAVQDYLSVPVWARYLRCARSPPPPRRPPPPGAPPAGRPARGGGARGGPPAGRGTVPRGGPHEAPSGQVPGRLPAVLAATARPAFPRPPGLARAGCARRHARA